MRRYSKIQCIAFDIDTGHSHKSETPSYIGLGDDAADLEKRIRLMRDAISTPLMSNDNFRSSLIDPSPDTLKIFMAPEFFFRGTKGYYSIKLISKIMPELRKKVNEARFKDWLFIFGTAVGGLNPSSTRSHKITNLALGDSENRHNSQQEFVNIALIQPGGDPNNTGRIVYKECFSDVDFHHAQGKAVKQIEGERGRGPEEFRKDGSGLGGESIFKYAGITFGLEVCLDHFLGRLKRSAELSEGGSQMLPNSGVDIQLITSCGLTQIQPYAIAARNQGYIFKVDGTHTTGLYKKIAANQWEKQLMADEAEIRTSWNTVFKTGFLRESEIHREEAKETRIITFPVCQLPHDT